MLALIDDAGSTWPHAFDLAAGCIDAWFRAAARSIYAGDGIAAILGAALVRVVTETAISFSLVPPEPVRVALYRAFWFLAIFLHGIIVVTFIVGFATSLRRAWRQWFDLIHERPTIAGSLPRAAIADPSSRQVLALWAVILIAAVGADFTRGQTANAVFGLPQIPFVTYFMLSFVRVFLSMFAFASDMWRARRVK
jgi:hypothetical protein